MTHHPAWFEKVKTFSSVFLARFKVRGESEPIDSRDRLFEFVASRAAFVAQKTLYGYLKTRMGTRYPTMFEDDMFVESINIAKMHVFAGCLSDLTVWSVANALADISDDDLKRETAKNCFAAGLTANGMEAPEAFVLDDALRDFNERLSTVEWDGPAKGRDTFSVSPAALYEWAPIAPNLKKFDREIVWNSIVLTWFEIRERFNKRLVSSDIISELTPSHYT